MKISEIKNTIKLLLQVLNLTRQIQKVFMEIMIRKTCREEGLSKGNEDLIVAVIWSESGMDPNAVNDNGNGTIDYGLCQFNDYWYWKKEQIIHPDVALHNPKKAVQVMIKQFKRGRLKNWVGYSSGLYRKYLKSN